MIPCFDKHNAKQFIRGKPVRFGYKMWVLTTPLGYVLQFEAYQGARGRQTEYPGLGMGGSVVIDLISELQEEIRSSYHLTIDNLFTSYNLVDCLTSKGIAHIGNLRSNRFGDAPLKSVKEMETLKRGFLTSQLTPRTEWWLCDETTTMSSIQFQTRSGCTHCNQQKDGQDQTQRELTLVSLSIITKQWVEWTGWTKTWTNIARPSGPKSAGGLYLHSAWTSASSKCGTCYD